MYGGVRVSHRFNLPASGDVVLLVLEHETLGATLGHARDPRARPAHHRHVRVRDRRGGRVAVFFGAGGGLGEVVRQGHAVDAILDAGKRQPLEPTHRPVLLSEHD